MSIPKGSEVEAQAQGTGSTATPSSVPPPCPSGDVPKEGSRDIQKQGKIISVPYDWCKSQQTPVPYRIWAWQSSASNLANTVRQTDCGSHVLGSIVNQCYGDEPGTGGGVKSGTNLAECTPLSASPTVRAEGRPMVRYLDKWWMNHGNTWGCLNNSEDMGKYDTPKLQQIDQTMVAQVAADTMSDAGEGVANKPLVIPPPPISAPGAIIGAGGVAYGGLAAGVGLVGISRGQATVDDAANAAAGLPAQPRTPIMGLPMNLDPSAPGTGNIPVYPQPTLPDTTTAESRNAQNRAKALAAAQIKPLGWVRFSAAHACAALACGTPGSKYRGGSYQCLKGGAGTTPHHTPMASVSYLPYGAGPAVEMDANDDHALTASYQYTGASIAHQASQVALVSSGNFVGAAMLDVADINHKFPDGRYDAAIVQMMRYLLCLKANGFVR